MDRNLLRGESICRALMESIHRIGSYELRKEYFNRFDIYDAQMVRLVAFDMTGEGAKWYISMKSNRLLSSWADFKEKVMIRFGNPYAPEKLPISTINSESKELAVDQCFELEMNSSSQFEVVEEEFLPLSYALEEKEQVEQEDEVLEPQVEQFDADLKQVSYVEEKTTIAYDLEQNIEVIQSLEIEEVVLEANWSIMITATKYDPCESVNCYCLVRLCGLFELVDYFVIQRRNSRGGVGGNANRRIVMKLYALKEVFKKFLEEF